MARLQPWSIHQGLNVQPVNSSRWITPQLWSVIHKEALKQCDALDGVSCPVILIVSPRPLMIYRLQVKDGVISNPEVCE
jgi:hypothetical protein